MDLCQTGYGPYAAHQLDFLINDAQYAIHWMSVSKSTKGWAPEGNRISFGCCIISGGHAAHLGASGRLDRELQYRMGKHM